MKWIAQSLLVSCLIMIGHLSFALKVSLEKTYYQIAPTDATLLDEAMINSSNKGSNHHHTVGGYTASAVIRTMSLVYHDQTCSVEKFEMNLKGIMLLPKLKIGNYALKVRQAFDDKLEHIMMHESEHERIWRLALLNFEESVRLMNGLDNPSCDALVDKINAEMLKTLQQIDHANILFDCVSYGDDLVLAQCASID